MFRTEKKKKEQNNTCAFLQSRKESSANIPRVICLPIASHGHVTHAWARHWAVAAGQSGRLTNAVGMTTVLRGHAAS